MKTITYLMCFAVNVAFFQGLLYMIGIAPSVPKAIILLSSSFAFLLTIIYFKIRNLIFLSTFVLVLLAFSYIVFISHSLNDSILKETLSFYHYTFVACLSFFIFANLPLNSRLLAVIQKNFEILIVFQIIFIVYKFFKWGITESIVGTISYRGGALYTIFPLLAITYFISKFFYFKKKKIYLFFCVGLFFMAFVGGKRAIYFFLPVVLIVIFLIKNHIETSATLSMKNLKTVGILCAAMILIVNVGVRVTPTLNPEKSHWGSFDINHVVKYVKFYNYRPNREYVRGRIAGLFQAYKYIANSDITVFLFGSGPDKLINYKSRDGTERKYGINNSGAITGLATYLISVGVLGSALIIILYFLVGRQVYKTMRRQNNKPHSVVYYLQFFVFCGTFVFMLDFIFYTRAFVQTHALNFLFFILAGISINKNLRFRTSINTIPTKTQIS